MGWLVKQSPLAFYSKLQVLHLSYNVGLDYSSSWATAKALSSPRCSDISFCCGVPVETLFKRPPVFRRRQRSILMHDRLGSFFSRPSALVASSSTDGSTGVVITIHSGMGSFKPKAKSSASINSAELSSRDRSRQMPGPLKDDEAWLFLLQLPIGSLDVLCAWRIATLCDCPGTTSSDVSSGHTEGRTHTLHGEG